MIYKTITVKQRAHEQNENVCESPTYFQQNINDPQFVSRKVAINASSSLSVNTYKNTNSIYKHK